MDLINELTKTQDFHALLVWIMSGAGAAALISFIAERVPAFDGLMPSNKRLIMVVGSILLALGSKVLLEFAPGFVEIVAPYVQVAIVAGLAVKANQMFHDWDKGS